MVQLDHDEEVGPVLGMYGTLDAELEVQVPSRELSKHLFWYLFRRVVGSSRLMLTTKVSH